MAHVKNNRYTETTKTGASMKSSGVTGHDSCEGHEYDLAFFWSTG
jgi:hypothetical protein